MQYEKHACPADRASIGHPLPADAIELNADGITLATLTRAEAVNP